MAAIEFAEYLCGPANGWKCAALSSCARIRTAAASDTMPRLTRGYFLSTQLISISLVDFARSISPGAWQPTRNSTSTVPVLRGVVKPDGSRGG